MLVVMGNVLEHKEKITSEQKDSLTKKIKQSRESRYLTKAEFIAMTLQLLEKIYEE